MENELPSWLGVSCSTGWAKTTANYGSLPGTKCVDFPFRNVNSITHTYKPLKYVFGNFHVIIFWENSANGENSFENLAQCLQIRSLVTLFVLTFHLHNDYMKLKYRSSVKKRNYVILRAQTGHYYNLCKSGNKMTVQMVYSPDLSHCIYLMTVSSDSE